ncbi:MAG: cytochrome b N-terminal domain-containing protein [Nitrospirae bacterium]|nr:cytochrome b N-terminal domain-containing protein [Nitrospirota bacterium]
MTSRPIEWINRWINERWPLSAVLRLAIDEEIPGGSRFVYTDGSAVFLLFTLQAITGILQVLFYVPTVDHAYDSLNYLRTEVPFGWLIHGMHFWGANLMIVVLALHMTRAFIWGAYKKPRELVWLAGVLLLLVTMGFSFTGSPLTWDQHGYWAGEVGTSIAGTIPVVGDMQKRLLRGGEGMGQLTLSRFFALHTMVLPLLLVSAFGLHIIAFKVRGTVGPWDALKRRLSGPFWPDQVYKDVLTGSAIFILLIFLSVFVPPVFWGPVDILDTNYVPKPDWNFLFLYQVLKYFQGPLEPVGTVGVPTVIVLLFVTLPFTDRNPEKNPFRRPLVMLCGFIFAVTITALTLLGYYSRGLAELPAGSPAVSSLLGPDDAGAAKTPSVSQPSDQSAPAQKTGGMPSATVETNSRTMPGEGAHVIGNAERGGAVFGNYCAGCHGAKGAGGMQNPGSDEGKVPQLNPVEREIYNKDPKAFAENLDRFIQHGLVPPGKKPLLSMPAFGDTHGLTQQQIANVEAYIMSLNGIDRGQIVNPGMEPRNFFILVASVYILMLFIQGGIRIKSGIP